jgi:DNA-binding winged helix-turn-helix (wHTH) protein
MESEAPILRFEEFEARLDSGELLHGGRRIALQRMPFELLTLLLESSGGVVTRAQIRARLWPDGTHVDYEHGVNTALKKLRRALADSPQRPRFVETLPMRGYRFLAPVAPSAGP